MEKDKDNINDLENNDEEITKINLLDVLLDEDNTAPIFMLDDRGNQLKFEQIAVIPYGEDDIYTILKPLTKIDGIKDNEAIVFKVCDDEDGEPILRVEEDVTIAEEIMESYYELIAKEIGKTLQEIKEEAVNNLIDDYLKDEDK